MSKFLILKRIQQFNGNSIPSTKMPIRNASVPVSGYLSFLASSSAIANDLIALADHLYRTIVQYTYNSSIIQPRAIMNYSSIIQQINQLTNFGILSGEAVSGFLKLPKKKEKLQIKLNSLN